MSLRLITTFLIATLSFVTLAAQQQTPPAPQQTARQALIETINGGEEAVLKHLTVEVQQLLDKPENKQGLLMLSMAGAMKSQAGSDMQTFETGPVLLSVNQPKEHAKFEVRVDNDDLNGDQDVLQLSVHMFRDGQEQTDEWGYMSSHFAVSMNRQQNIWRLSNISVSLEFPLGDPEFLKKTFLKATAGNATGMGAVAAGVRTDIKPDSAPAFDPAAQVQVLGFAEQSFARLHPEAGFTCSLSELTEFGAGFGVDKQLTAGNYNGYKFSLAGCEGKPAGSFQISAEPVLQGRGAKAFCIDATANLRVSEDGRAASCFGSGKVYNSAPNEADGMTSFGVDVEVHKDLPKP